MNIGIIGAGKIAAKMAETVNKMEGGVRLYAIASRSAEKARRFAAFWGCETAYGSYEEMVRDPKVDLVYIATPHSHHFEHARLCIEYGKPALCEKAFTANARQAEDLVRLSEGRGVFLAEAAWTRYMPSRKMLKDLIAGEKIGRITSLTANIGYAIGDLERLHTPALAGGALLDIGYYPLSFALMAFGSDYRDVRAWGIKTESGVDCQEGILLEYPDRKLASLFVTMNALTDRRGQICGEKGYIEVDNVNNIQTFSVYNEHRELTERHEVPKQITGYEYEVLACQRALENGLLECPEMPHSESIRMMKLKDEIRRQLGVRYPFE